MANEKRLIDANALLLKIEKELCHASPFFSTAQNELIDIGLRVAIGFIVNQPTVETMEVVRCQNCTHAEPLDHNCELSTTHYLHCKLWRGEETKNVWHKYKKYYKDYSLVERDGFCSDGAKMDAKE